MAKVERKYEKRFYYWQEIRKQEKKSVALCHFCTNKCCCLLEDSLKDNKWCPVFQPKSNTFYSTNKWSIYSKTKPLRVLKVLQALMAMYAEAAALCLDNEKPIVERTGQCPECHVRREIKPSGLIWCSHCAKWCKEKTLRFVTTTYKSPMTGEMVDCKAAIARSIERVTGDVEREFLGDGKRKEGVPAVQERTSKKKGRNRS
jgi:hypothetical protein